MSMRDFQRLRELVLPLEVFRYDLTYKDVDTLEVRLGDLVPASVTQLVLHSDGTAPDDWTALRLLFHDFGAMKAARFPALDKIVSDCAFVEDEYESLYEQIALENEDQSSHGRG
ncbi:hypothetical protein PG994_003231 [Apiospora phragmitis]|uniref:Uncharacterized protein n=1 Tax=Apiospora phragmitis TaxID=2905665 RepID=A0ABR1VXL1_9PEZI